MIEWETERERERQSVSWQNKKQKNCFVKIELKMSSNFLSQRLLIIKKSSKWEWVNEWVSEWVSEWVRQVIRCTLASSIQGAKYDEPISDGLESLIC